MKNNETYIGDGVYVSYVEGMFKLRTPRYNNNTDRMENHIIYLGHQELDSFKNFVSNQEGK